MQTFMNGKLDYPEAHRDEVVDDYHGTKVTDPYRWLEDANAPAAQDWVDKQNAITYGYLNAIPIIKDIKARLTEIWDFPRYSLPAKEGGKYFYWK